MQDASLFRAEALEFRNKGQFSSFLKPPHIDHIWLLCILMIIALLATGWLVNRHYIRYQTLKGQVLPDMGLLVHRSNITGRVETIRVSPGDYVDAGQVLMTIGAMNFDRAGTSISEERLQTIEQRLVALSEQDERLERLASLRLSALNAELVAAELQIDRLQAALTDQATIIEVAQQRHARMAALVNEGHVSKVSAEDAQTNIKRLMLQNNALQSDKLAANDRLQNVLAQLQQLPLETEQALAVNQEQRMQLNQLLLESQGHGGQVIVAANAGFVDEIAIHVGEEVAPATPLINLMPAGSELLGELHIPTYAAGFVEAGQQLHLRYDAYPYQKYGVYQGEIVSLSETPYGDPRGNFYYTAKVRLERDAITAHGREYALKTGMSFEADVVLSRRTFMEWLLEPLYSLRRTGSSI